MKTLFASLFLFAVTTVSFNTEATENLDSFAICDGLSEIATGVMENRQSGITHEESIELAKGTASGPLKQVIFLMLESAYDEPLETTPELKRASIILFASLQRSECIMHLHEK